MLESSLLRHKKSSSSFYKQQWSDRVEKIIKIQSFEMWMEIREKIFAILML